MANDYAHPAGGPQMLRVPELLSMILKGSSPPQLLAAATVCKGWKPVALELKWKTTPVKLSKALGRIERIIWKREIETWVADQDQPLRDKLIENFLTQDSHKVHILVLDLEVSASHLSRLHDYLAASGKPFFPNLRAVHIHEHAPNVTSKSIDIIPLIKCTSILSVTVSQVVPAFGKKVLELFQSGCAVSTLELKTSATGFCTSLFSSFSRLEKLSHHGYLHPVAWAALSGGCRMKEISLADWQGAQEWRAEDLTVVTFPTLRHLSLRVRVPIQIVDAVVTKSRFPSLLYLQLHLAKSSDGASAHAERTFDFLRVTVDNCPLMEEMDLTINGSDAPRIIDRLDGSKNLRTLSIRTSQGDPIQLSSDDVTRLHTLLPALHTLDLDSDLISLPLSALAELSVRKLTASLRLTDLTLPPEPYGYEPHSLTEVVFRHLQLRTANWASAARAMARIWPSVRFLKVHLLECLEPGITMKLRNNREMEDTFHAAQAHLVAKS